MTLFTLILDSLYAGLLLIAAGWAFDLLHARQRHRAARPRPADPYRWDRYAPVGPHLTRIPAPEPGRSTWA